MVDVKKLVTAFLVLASLTSSAALIFVDYGNEDSADSDVSISGIRSAENEASLLQVGQNAYVEPIPSNSALSVATPEGGAASDVAPDFAKSGNLTESLAGKLANQIVELNPNGPTTVNGEAGLVPPDPNAIIQELAADPELQRVLAQNWEAQITIASFKKLEKYSQEDLYAYGEALNAIFDKNFVKSGITELVSDASRSSLQTLTSAKTVFEQVELEASRVAVPEPAEGFHTTFLEIAAFQKNQIALAQDQTDPLKSALILEAQQGKENELLLKLSQEFQKIHKIVFAPNAERGGVFVAGMNALFGIPKAHAFLGFGDIVHDPIGWIGQTIREIAKIVKAIVVQTLKNYLVRHFVNQTLDWIKNGGKPRFAINLKDMARDVTKDVAAETLYKIAPGICGYFSPLIIQKIRSDYNVSLQQAAGRSCSLEQIVANVKQFYEDFEQGRWTGYGTTLLPSGNFFGSLFANSQVVVNRSKITAEAQEEEVKAGGGFIGTKICGTPKVLTVADIYCQTQNECTIPPGNYDEDDAKSAAKLIGYDYLGGFVSNASGTFNACAKGDYQTTTPGGSIGAAIDNALPAPLHNIVNSQDIVGLISTLIDSAITKVISLGERGIKNTPTPGSTTTVTPPPTTQEGLLNEANAVMSSKQSALSMYSDIMNNASATIWKLDLRLVVSQASGGVFQCEDLDVTNWRDRSISIFSPAVGGRYYYCSTRNWFADLSGGLTCVPRNPPVGTPGYPWAPYPYFYLDVNQPKAGLQPVVDALKTQIDTLGRFIDAAQATPSDAPSSVWLAASTQLRTSDCSAPPPPAFAQCGDGIDNDGDTYVDLQDAQCVRPDDNSESTLMPPPPFYLSSCATNWGGTVVEAQRLVDRAQDIIADGIGWNKRATQANCWDGGWK